MIVQQGTTLITAMDMRMTKKQILEKDPIKGRDDDSSESERMTLKGSMSPSVDNICASGSKEDEG